jgi:hypothetical protein
MTGTTSITQERFYPAQECTTNSSTAGSHLQQGLTNPEYKGTQKDLTDEEKRLQGYADLRGIKVSL